MKKFILSTLSIILISFLGVVVWMNLTPGYFQMGECVFGYYTDAGLTKEIEKMPWGGSSNYHVDCRTGLAGRVLLMMSTLDFNRGPKTLPPVNTSNQDKINKASTPSPIVPPDTKVPPAAPPVYKYGPEKATEVVVQDGSYYGPPFDPKLFQLEISQSQHLFAKSETVDLKNYLGKRVKIRYREVVGIVMGEQQLVMVDSVGL